MANKKILIITYYWPPSGGSGVQRWLKFVKYLCRLEWEPVVYTVENPSFTTRDESLLKDVPPTLEVMKLPIWEPYEAFNRLSRFFTKGEIRQTDYVSTKPVSWFRKLSAWIRGNFFIPDPRIFWVKPSVEFLQEFLKSNQISRVITTGPPHSIHLIGLKLKRKNPSLQWVADFRDPWSEWDLLDTLSLTSFARSRHRKLEKQVLQAADRVTTIAPYHVQRFEALGGRKVELITNGFDEDDFQGIKHTRNEMFTIRHVGIVDELRDPRPVMEAIREMCTREPGLKLRVEFIGNVNSAFSNFIVNDPLLNSITRFTGNKPHDELLQLYGSTDLQLLVLAHTPLAPGNLPGKFFEYLASQNPILAIGPVSGDAGNVIREVKAGEIYERTDLKGIQESLIRFYQNWKSGHALQASDRTAYSRHRLTQKLVALLDSF